MNGRDALGNVTDIFVSNICASSLLCAWVHTKSQICVCEVNCAVTYARAWEHARSQVLNLWWPYLCTVAWVPMIERLNATAQSGRNIRRPRHVSGARRVAAALGC